MKTQKNTWQTYVFNFLQLRYGLIEVSRMILFTFINSFIAIILARAPKEFTRIYMPKLLYNNIHSPVILDISSIIQPELLNSLLQFWYTASCSTSFIDAFNELGIQIDTISNKTQLIKDIKRMLIESIATDVTIQIISSDYQNVNTTFRAHKFLLTTQSPYFYSLFCTQFREASSPTIHLTDDIFDSTITNILLHFFYTNEIIMDDLINEGKHYQLSVLQRTFYAADYLGLMLCNALLLDKMRNLCHQFKCHCPDCACLLPSMLAWSEKQSEALPELKASLISHYSHPVGSIPHLWSQRSFAVLVASLVPSNLGENMLKLARGGKKTIACEGNIIEEIEGKTFENINKHNAVQVLQSLYLCLSHIRSIDHPTPTWSQPALDLLEPLLHYTVHIISRFFDFYCVEYPILPSCVDGTAFSIDFLDFLLRHVLDDMHESNAGKIYQGITRDLLRRQITDDVLSVLQRAKVRCALFIRQQWTAVKSHVSLYGLEPEILRELSEEIGVPYRSLIQPHKKSLIRRWSVEHLMDAIRSKPRENHHLHSTILVKNEPILRKSTSLTSLSERLLFLDPIQQEHKSNVFKVQSTPSSRSLRKYLSSINAYLIHKKGHPKKKNKMKGSGGDDDVDDGPFVGDRVKVLHRPLPTYGTIQYVGPVQFADGLYIGIELDNRCNI